jgi:hypothetical protein
MYALLFIEVFPLDPVDINFAYDGLLSELRSGVQA